MTVRTRPYPARLLTDEKQLGIWLSNAQPRDVLEYHRGFLVIDRDEKASRLGELERRQLDRVAYLLFTLAASGRGYLLQRRNGRNDFSYLFVFSARPLDRRRGLFLIQEVQS